MLLLRKRSRGQALVEFALALPVLLVIFMGLFDFGRAVFAYNSLSNAAREGARVAIVDQTVVAGVPVTFSASATGCTITAYSWTFPLGTPGTSTVAGPVVTFSTPNNTSVTVSLTAQTSVGPRTATDSFNLKK